MQKIKDRKNKHKKKQDRKSRHGRRTNIRIGKLDKQIIKDMKN